MSSLGLAVVVGVAGAMGAAARFGMAEWVARWWWGRFPLATLLINVSGAFALGVLLAAGGAHAALGAPLRMVLGTGFLGGYTTFSTLTYETHRLARRGDAGSAWLNALGTLFAGMGAAALGILIGVML